ncbi:FAD-dependent oxidoreductase [Akkermansiaceae bacterium]|nr:FAD-dependent oxidoreductase [Akkermansiaceae bacterium]
MKKSDISPNRLQARPKFWPFAILGLCMAALSSHVAFGSIRMEPVFMILGQSAGTAAVLAIDKGVAVQQVGYGELKSMLLEGGQRL